MGAPDSSISKARKIFKKTIIKSAEIYNLKFKYINIFNTIIDDVFINSKINHHDDTMLTYLNKSYVKETMGWNSIEYRRKTDIFVLSQG